MHRARFAEKAAAEQLERAIGLDQRALTGDAMAHAILPGAAIGYLIAGLSLGAMTAGGLIAGFVVAVASGAVAR